MVKLFDGAYGTGTIVREGAGCFDVARPYVYAHETGGFSTGVEIVRGVNPARLVPAEVDSQGNPRTFIHGCYTYEDLRKVARGEWKID